MASVRKRVWATRGFTHQAWVVDYSDAKNVRRSKQFKLKKEADSYRLTVGVALRAGVHVADTDSITVTEAAEAWLRQCGRRKLGDLTIEDYRRHVDKQIIPRLGSQRLTTLTSPLVKGFVDEVTDDAGLDMARRVLKSLKSIISEAEGAGSVGTNVALRVKCPTQAGGRAPMLIPTKEEMRKLVLVSRESSTGFAYALILLAMFCALRASELRGLSWPHVDLARGRVNIERRADRKCRLGNVKSAAGRRSVPMPPALIAALKVWKASCPKGPLDLVFPTNAGTVMDYGNLIERIFAPMQVLAGLIKPSVGGDDSDGLVRIQDAQAKYGLHALRHYAASIWIHNKVDLKRLQSWMGHADIRTTINLYGHLIEAAEDDIALATEIEFDLLG